MLQSAFRPISNYLTTNWPTLWAARLDVALGYGLLLLAFGAPIFWLGRGPLLQTWGTSEIGNILAIVALLMATGALILWVISVGRVYIRGISPRMSQYPRFIDILLGTVMIVTPTALLSFVAASGLVDIGFNLWSFVAGVVCISVALSTMLAFILTTILRSSMRVAILSFLGVTYAADILQWAVQSLVNPWFPTPRYLLIALAIFASLIWIVSGTSHVRTRERLIAIGFPALFVAAFMINGVVLQWVGFGVLAEQGSGLDYPLTYANPHAAFVQAPLALAVTIFLGEVLSRRWARLSLMPK